MAVRSLGRRRSTTRILVAFAALLSLPLILICYTTYLLGKAAIFSQHDAEERSIMPHNENGGAVTAREARDIIGSSERIIREETVEWNPTAIFTPEEFVAGNKDKYVNHPVLPINVTVSDVHRSVLRAVRQKVAKPFGLMWEAHPKGANLVMGLAAWPEAMSQFIYLVGSLRGHARFDGHIILGVHSQIPPREREYLKSMDVTFYSVEFVDCDESVAVGGDDPNNVVRGKCARGTEDLKLEWGRFAMARRWLRACEGCTGWAMVCDTRDLFFQADPFAGLPPPRSSPHDLLFVEEVSKHTCPEPQSGDSRRYYVLGNSFYRTYRGSCYGEYQARFLDRPVLCSGTIIGTREGMDRFLAVYVDEFHANNRKENWRCRCPHSSDQLILQYMYYNGRFGGFERTRTVPWGTGPVNTIGHVCVDNTIPDPNKRHSAKDMVRFDEATGLIVNNHEGEGSKFRVSPAVHQWDRCHNWIQPFFRQHSSLFDQEVAKANILAYKNATARSKDHPYKV